MEGFMKATLTGSGALAMLLFFAPVAISEDSKEEVIRQTLVAMWDAIENADVDRYASYIHPDFTAFGEYDTYITKGKDLEVRGYAD